MVNVLRVGTKNQATCGHCGSVLQFSDADIQLVYSPVQVGPYEVECMPEAEDHYQAKILCPVCNKGVRVAASRSLKRDKLAAQRLSDMDV